MNWKTRAKSGQARFAVAGLLAIAMWAAWALPSQASPNPWHETGDMSGGHYDGAGVLLPTGEVLVAGGYDSYDRAELYDPATGTFSPTGKMGDYRERFTLSLLPDGTALAAGGHDPFE